MDYKKLGNSDLMVSSISFGCMSLSGPDAENTRLLHEAFDRGINLFDTADLYDKGANEVLVGKAFRENRRNIILATKVGNQWRPDGSGWDWNPTKAYILQAVEASLQRLQTDYIDLYQLHGGTLEDPVDETIEAFELLKQQGKIRFYGISSIRPNVISRWIERSNLSSVMLQYSLLDRRPEETVLPQLQEKGIGVLARGSLAQGLLLGKPPKPYLEHAEAIVYKAANSIQQHCKAGHSPTGLALQWVLSHPALTTAVVGIRTQEQLDAALLASLEQPLTQDTYNSLSAAVPANFYQQHRT